MRQISYFLLALAVERCAALPRQVIVEAAASSVLAPSATAAIFSETHSPSPILTYLQHLTGDLKADFEDSGHELMMRDLKTRTSTIATIRSTSTSSTSHSTSSTVSTSSSSVSTKSSTSATSSATSSSSSTSAPSASASDPVAASTTSAATTESSTTAVAAPTQTAKPTVNPFTPSPPSPSLTLPPPQKNWLHIGIAIGVFAFVAIAALSIFAFVRYRILKSINEKRAAKFAREGTGRGPRINVTDVGGNEQGAEMAEMGHGGANIGKGHVRNRSSVSGRARKESVAVSHGPQLPPRNVEKYEVPAISWEGRRRMLTAQGLQIWDSAKTWPGQLGQLGRKKGGDASPKATGWPTGRDV